MARITNVAVLDVPCKGDEEFRIIPSCKGETIRTLISPDVTVCHDCLRELLDPQDRRYRYPFINCTNCGPRFTIVSDIPYDRPRTSMAVFPMCPACQAEYDDPLNRRFHAQPNACWDCGPRLELWDKSGQQIANDDPIVRSVAALSAGMIVAVKGLGGFHLAVDATNAAAVALLRGRKRRTDKSFAFMVPNLEIAETLCEVSEAARTTLLSVQRPIVLLRRKLPSPVVDQVAPFNHYLGVFLPYTPLHHLLFTDWFAGHAKYLQTRTSWTNHGLRSWAESIHHRCGSFHGSEKYPDSLSLFLRLPNHPKGKTVFNSARESLGLPVIQE